MARVAFIMDRIFRKFGLAARASSHAHWLWLVACLG